MLYQEGNTYSRRHGATKMLPNGKVTKTPTYHSWAAMNDRCYNDRHKWWSAYGGRGITVCERWRRSRTNRDAFNNFVEDMGERPNKFMTLDRIDVNGNYELYKADGTLQCRWADKATQRANVRGKDESH
jgi:hypothetical protein